MIRCRHYYCLCMHRELLCQSGQLHRAIDLEEGFCFQENTDEANKAYQMLNSKGVPQLAKPADEPSPP